MNTGTSVMHCAHCGRPIGWAAVWIGDLPYHQECTHGPGWQQPTYATMPTWAGAAQQKALSEADIRRIVREELAAIQRKA